MTVTKQGSKVIIFFFLFPAPICICTFGSVIRLNLSQSIRPDPKQWECPDYGTYVGTLLKPELEHFWKLMHYHQKGAQSQKV